MGYALRIGPPDFGDDDINGAQSRKRTGQPSLLSFLPTAFGRQLIHVAMCVRVTALLRGVLERLVSFGESEFDQRYSDFTA